MDETGGVPTPPELPTTGSENAEPPLPLPRKPVNFPDWLLVLCLIAWVCWSFGWPRPKNDTERMAALYYPAGTALWFCGAEMFAYQGGRQLGETGQALLWWGEEPEGEMVEWVTGIMQESIAELERRGDMAGARQLRRNLVIMAAELGDARGVKDGVAKLRKEGESAHFLQLFQLVYADAVPATGMDEYEVLGRRWMRPAEFNHDELGMAWPRWQFEAKVAHLKGEHERADWLQDWLREREAKQGMRLVRITLLNWLLLLLGIMAAGVYVFKRGWRGRMGVGENVFPMTAREGLGVFLLASLAGQVLFWVLSKSPVFTMQIWGSHSLIWAVPVVVAVWWCLGRHDPVALGQFFGWSGGADGLVRLLKIGLVAFPVGWCALMLPNVILEAMGVEGHWTEGWTEASVSEPWPGRLLLVINMAVWAPLQEEMLMRGILYAALRRRLGVTASVLLSASIFGVLHFYSFAGLVSVTCFGIAMAWLYERTGSWIPGFVVHLLTNLLLSLWQIAMMG